MHRNVEKCTEILRNAGKCRMLLDLYWTRINTRAPDGANKFSKTLQAVRLLSSSCVLSAKLGSGKNDCIYRLFHVLSMSF